MADFEGGKPAPYPSGCVDPVERYIDGLSLIEHLILRIFDDCSTQWVVAVGMGGGGRIGLNYSAVESIVRANGLAWNADVIELIGVCERTVLADDAVQRAADRAASEAANPGRG